MLLGLIALCLVVSLLAGLVGLPVVGAVLCGVCC